MKKYLDKLFLFLFDIDIRFTKKRTDIKKNKNLLI